STRGSSSVEKTSCKLKATVCSPKCSVSLIFMTIYMRLPCISGLQLDFSDAAARSSCRVDGLLTNCSKTHQTLPIAALNS
ncbi:hypothetical protein V2P20_19780, partial [Methylobacter sp. Wu1]|uniref:hypothetical protein n=1 Tax=Methylobacter sp. Wu1 TaxID=3119359 RepID=UPI002F95A6D5